MTGGADRLGEDCKQDLQLADLAGGRPLPPAFHVEGILPEIAPAPSLNGSYFGAPDVLLQSVSIGTMTFQ